MIYNISTKNFDNKYIDVSHNYIKNYDFKCINIFSEDFGWNLKKYVNNDEFLLIGQKQNLDDDFKTIKHYNMYYNQNLCSYSNCGNCINICPKSLYYQNEDKINLYDNYTNDCLECGLCTSYCYSNALLNNTDINYNNIIKSIQVKEYNNNKYLVLTDYSVETKYEDKILLSQDIKNLIPGKYRFSIKRCSNDNHNIITEEQTAIIRIKLNGISLNDDINKVYKNYNSLLSIKSSVQLSGYYDKEKTKPKDLKEDLKINSFIMMPYYFMNVYEIESVDNFFSCGNNNLLTVKFDLFIKSPNDIITIELGSAKSNNNGVVNIFKDIKLEYYKF